MSTGDDTGSVGEVLREIAEAIGPKAWLTNAEWGQRFAELLWASGDEAAIKHVLADGAEGYRSKELSQTRRAAREASRHILASNSAADAQSWLAQQLSFEVCAPGQPPVPLRDARHALLKAAYLADSKRLEGHLQNNLQLKRAVDVTQPYPDRTVGELIASGAISPADLALAS